MIASLVALRCPCDLCCLCKKEKVAAEGVPIVAVGFRRGCRRSEKWWHIGWSMLLLFFYVSRVVGREGRLLLVLPLRLRKGVASAGSVTAAEERCGCGGGYNWASSSARFWLLLV